MENNIKRKFYNFAKWLEQRVAANMIAGNLSSALTNFIPLTQAGARLGHKWLLRGMWNTIRSYKTDDGMVELSDFLTNRRGSDPLVRTWQDKGSKIVGTPMELIDQFAAGSIVRAAYYKNLKKGMTEEDALHQADLFAASVMADRSKGAMPTIFQAMNPWTKLFTQFQLEVNNQFSEVFKDIPRELRAKGKLVILAKLLQYFFGAWLFNELFEFVFGRRPALDPFGILNEAIGDFTGYELPNLLELGTGAITGDVPSFETEKVGVEEGLKNLGANILGELPFNAALGFVGIGEDSRVPLTSALPDVGKLINAATDGEQAPKKRLKTAVDELIKPVTYLLPPFGGNQMSKVVKGIEAVARGGSYSVDKDGNDVLQYPVYDDPWSVLRAVVMGKNSLPEAQAWVDSGFDGFDAKGTAAYQGMTDAGVDERDAYALIDALRKAEGLDAQREVLDNTEVSAEGKVIAYCGTCANDKEIAWIGRMLESDPDMQSVVDVAVGLKAANALNGNDARIARADVLEDANLTDQQKIIAVETFLGTEWETPSGSPSAYAKFRNALEAGLSVDEYMDLYASRANMDDFFELIDSGLDADAAAKMLTAMEGEKASAGEDGLTKVDRWKVAVESQDNAEDQLAALSAVMTESQHRRAVVANEFNVRPELWVQIQEKLPQYDADGNGSYKQDEVTSAVEAMGRQHNMSTAQKAALWQLLTGSTSTKNNPYNKDIGQKVIDRVEKLEKEGDDSLSFSGEIMRQLMARA